MMKPFFFQCSAWGLALIAVTMVGCRILIPPRALTDTRIQGTRFRIQQFAANHGRMPRSLAELPLESNKDCAVVDAWDRPLLWSYDATKAKFTIGSLGRDGKPGGVGDDADIYLTDSVTPDLRSSPPSSHFSGEEGISG